MEGAPPPSQPPEPLSTDDIRGLRRWVTVAGVWAVAATVIALIALLDTSDSEAEKDADAATDRVVKVQRALDGRFDALERRLEGLARSDDVSRLQQRLSRVEKSASEAARSSESADDKAADLEERVQQLEDDADSGRAADEEQR